MDFKSRGKTKTAQSKSTDTDSDVSQINFGFLLYSDAWLQRLISLRDVISHAVRLPSWQWSSAPLYAFWECSLLDCKSFVWSVYRRHLRHCQASVAAMVGELQFLEAAEGLLLNVLVSAIC